jgi:hypothetical protein
MHGLSLPIYTRTVTVCRSNASIDSGQTDYPASGWRREGVWICSEHIDQRKFDFALNDTPRKFDGLKLACIDPDSRAIGLFTRA